jgi:hypothetical protein
MLEKQVRIKFLIKITNEIIVIVIKLIVRIFIEIIIRK